ncbi:MAG: hypothetical protein ACOC2W_03890 [bacterium]
MKINRFIDIENLEFRKGSLEYGDMVKQLIEFLRIYKNENDDKLLFNLKDFEEQSKISKDDILEIIKLPFKNSLINFDIEIINNKILFTNLQNKKSIHSESVSILRFKDI